MSDFDEIVAGLDLEPIEVAVVRCALKEDWDERHPGSPVREVTHRVIDELVDDLRVYFEPGAFDGFVESQICK